MQTCGTLPSDLQHHRHSTACPAPAAIESSFHGLSVESVFRCCGSLLLLLQCWLESAETERHRGLDEPTSPFTSRAARNVGGQCSSCRFASPPPARGPRTIPFPHTSQHRSSNGPPPPLRPPTPTPCFFFDKYSNLLDSDEIAIFKPQNNQLP